MADAREARPRLPPQPVAVLLHQPRAQLPRCARWGCRCCVLVIHPAVASGPADCDARDDFQPTAATLHRLHKSRTHDLTLRTPRAGDQAFTSLRFGDPRPGGIPARTSVALRAPAGDAGHSCRLFPPTAKMVVVNIYFGFSKCVGTAGDRDWRSG